MVTVAPILTGPCASQLIGTGQGQMSISCYDLCHSICHIEKCHNVQEKTQLARKHAATRNDLERRHVTDKILHSLRSVIWSYVCY